MKGETLIEVLIALAIAVVVISSITVLSVSSLNNGQFVRDQDQANKYAQEGMEVVRSVRNSDYINFAIYNGEYCLNEGQTTLGNVAVCNAANVAGKFIRAVTITPNGCGVNLSDTVVTVSWTSSKCSDGSFCHNVQLQSCFSTVPPVSGP